MAAKLLRIDQDLIQPHEPVRLAISFNGEQLTGVLGQSIAGIIMANRSLGFRQTSVLDRPRGVFCGIGVCFDCLVVVNDLPDVRACLRRAADGDVVVTQHDTLPHGDAS